MGEFVMPSLGAEMDTGRLLTWYVEPGQRVRRGDVVAMVETDKANIDVEVFEDGVVEELLVEEGTRVPVGTPLARLGEGPAPAPVPPTVEHPGKGLYTPVLRRLARERGLDLDALHGTGPGGRVTRADVERATPEVAAESPPGRAAATPPGASGKAAAPPAPPRPAAAVPAEPGPTRASPYARRLAAERGIDPARLAGSGPDGAVVAGDLDAVAPRPTAELKDESRVEPPVATTTHPETAAPTGDGEDRRQAMRQAIARAMARSKREIPHYYLGEHVDLEEPLTWLEQRNADRPASRRVLPAALLLKAVALSCLEVPELNGFWRDDAFVPGEGVHLGVAISLRGGGLLAPAIRDADGRTLDELMSSLRELVARTRAGGLLGSELTDPTITVTNLGDTGVETVYGVIQPPQVALVGAGRITERAWASSGMVGSRRCLHLTLSADHRASDGHRGARFLAAVADHLRRPETL